MRMMRWERGSHQRWVDACCYQEMGEVWMGGAGCCWVLEGGASLWYKMRRAGKGRFHDDPQGAAVEQKRSVSFRWKGRRQ